VTRIAFIGMGAMGAPMAGNLLKAGFPVIVHNRTREREEPLAALGAVRAASPAEAAARADIVFTCVSDVPDVEEVICGPRGVLQGIGAGRLVVDTSTIGPKAARAIAARCAEAGVRFMDAPVSGGPPGAQQATLSIMAGGEATDLEEAFPALRAMGRTIVHCGPVGTGQATKLVNQIVGACTFCAVAEGLTFSKAAGLDGAKTIEAVGGGAAGSWMMTNLAPRMLAGDFEGGFKVSLQAKDLRLVLAEADEMGLPLPITRLVSQLLAWLEQNGHGQHGTQSIIAAYEAIRGFRKQ